MVRVTKKRNSCLQTYWTHLRISKDAQEGLAGENATLEEEAAVIRALATQDQKLVSR